MRQDRDGRGPLHRPNQLLAATRDDQVHESAEREQVRDRLSIDRIDEAHAPLREAGGYGGLGQEPPDYPVAAHRLSAALQDDGVPGLQAQGRGVGGDARPRLVDHADDAKRDPHPADQKAVRAAPHSGDLPDRIGQVCHLADPGHHLLDPAVVKGQPIEKRGGVSLRLRLRQIVRVGREDRCPVAPQDVRHRCERPVLDL